MEYAIMKAKLLIYQQRSKRSQGKQWKLHKEKFGEIIQEMLKSYQKYEELYQLRLETY